MKQLQFYKYTTWVLILFNLSMIAFFLFKKPPHKGEHFIKKATAIMQLDENQRSQFKQFAKRHHEEMRAIDKNQEKILQPYFQSIIDPSKVIDFEKSMRKIQDLEKDKIEITYQHFKEVKSILNKKQEAGFEVFMNQALKKLLLDEKKDRHHRRNFKSMESKN